MEQSHTDLGEGGVGAGASACPASPLSRLQRRLFIRLSARTHGMPGASTLARWQGEGREERGRGKEEGRGGSGDSDGEPLKSERPQQAPQGLNLHTEVCHSPVPTSLPTDKGSRAGETDAQMDGLCVRSHGAGGKEASKKGGGPGYGPWGSRTTVLML